LSPDYEKKPVEDSWGKYANSDIRKERYLNLSFKNDILMWLKEYVLPNIKIKDVYLRSAIEQYIDHLEGKFNLRTINNKMNMELKKFIKEELQLDGESFSAKYSKISEKIKDFEKVTVELKSYKEELLLPVKTLKSIIQTKFPQLEVTDGDEPNSYYDIYIKFEISGFEFYCTLSFLYNEAKYQSGIYSFNKENIKEIFELLDPLFEKKVIKKNDIEGDGEIWYGYNEVSYEQALEHFTNLVNAVIEEKEKRDNQNK
jgi:hypothetical protein